jgi:hypothetical protein
MVLHELLAHSLGDLAVVLLVNDGVDRHAGTRSRKDQLEHVAKARHRRKRTTAQGEGMTFSDHREPRFAAAVGAGLRNTSSSERSARSR